MQAWKARFVRIALILTVAGLAPSAALACAVCAGGTSDNRIEFILTTALLTFLPLGLIGGVIWYLRRRYLALANQPPSDATPRLPRATRATSS